MYVRKYCDGEKINLEVLIYLRFYDTLTDVNWFFERHVSVCTYVRPFSALTVEPILFLFGITMFSFTGPVHLEYEHSISKNMGHSNRQKKNNIVICRKWNLWF
jgi:hypothetical protein